MSISALHSFTARQNGAKSHGPVTNEGKIRSAQNARKHGLFGAIRLQPPEDQEAYSELLEAYLAEYQPRNIFEHRCVREMVDAEWRLASVRKTLAILEATHAAEAPPNLTPAEASATAFERMANFGNVLSLSLRYERHFQRQYEKAHHALASARRAESLDRQAIARRTDQAMVNVLKSIVEAPVPQPSPAAQKAAQIFVQNEPKTPAVKPQDQAFNPCIHPKSAPDAAFPSLVNMLPRT
jgi:hypothetical protein